MGGWPDVSVVFILQVYEPLGFVFFFRKHRCGPGDYRRVVLFFRRGRMRPAGGEDGFVSFYFRRLPGIFLVWFIFLVSLPVSRSAYLPKFIALCSEKF